MSWPKQCPLSESEKYYIEPVTVTHPGMTPAQLKTWANGIDNIGEWFERSKQLADLGHCGHGRASAPNLPIVREPIR